MSNGPMSTSNFILRAMAPDSVQHANRCLARELQRRYGLTLEVYKAIKALTDFAAVILAFYAIDAGVKPAFALGFVAFILGGWELFEIIAIRNDAISRRPSRRSQEDDEDD